MKEKLIKLWIAGMMFEGKAPFSFSGSALQQEALFEATIATMAFDEIQAGNDSEKIKLALNAKRSKAQKFKRIFGFAWPV